MRVAAIILAMIVCAVSTPGRSFELSDLDVFNLFGSRQVVPPVSRANLPYSVIFDIDGDSARAVRGNLQDASLLYRLREEPSPDGETLARRIAGDIAPLVDALWSLGYFNARVEIAVDRAAVTSAVGRPTGEPPSGLARAAERYRNVAPVPVVVRAVPGPQFTLRAIELVETGPGSGRALDDPAKIAGLKTGDPATSGTIRAAQGRIVDALRAASRPLARVTQVQPVVDHATRTMDVRFTVAPGPVAGIGTVGVGGNIDVPEPVIRSFIYLEPGDPYSPKALADTRKSVNTIPAIGSTRIREAEALDANGNLPIFVDVTERPKRLVGFAARYSTIDGPALRTYWEHRNLFGGAERLRLDGDILLAPRIDGTRIRKVGDFEAADIGGRFGFGFLKPALDGSRIDLLVDGVATRERVGTQRFGGYTARYANLTGSLRQRFTDTFSIQGGIEVERGQTSDVLGPVDYTLVGVPLSVRYDTTDSLLDPTRGVRITASVTPYLADLDRITGLVQTKATASIYQAIDADSRYVLAARLGFGSIAGAGLAEIPSTRRFYAGGGGSVRGYAFRSLSPLGPLDRLTGGRSLLEGSLEARIKITDQIGIVPFVDAGQAFGSSFPDFKEQIGLSAGLGLRYYTPIGPIRVDIATPLNPRNGDRPYALYVSIGQAF